MSNRLVARGTNSHGKRKLKPIELASPTLAFSLLLALYCSAPVRSESSYTGDQPVAGSISASSSATIGTLPPESTIGALPIPSQGSVTPEVLASLGNTVTNLQGSTLIIDVSTQPTPGTFNYSGTFNNAGTTYLISTSPAVSTAVLQATSIHNQAGGLITTILPSGGLTGYGNLVSNLSLSLVATNLIVNSGTISSAANLSVTAPQVINALPSGITAPSPVMSSINNLNVVSSNIVNAGIISAANNINIASQIASHILINNVGGVLSAINGNISVRDNTFVEKYNFALLGGDVLGDQLKIHTGEGILSLQVNQLAPTLSVFAGEGYISALSDIHVATLQYSGDPILNSGGDIVFQGDQVPPGSGNYTTICTGSGTFSGNNAYIDPSHPCDQIITSGLVLNLSGFAELGGATISSSTGVSITASGGMNLSSISAPSGIKLTSSDGSINTGNLTAGNSFVEVQSGNGSISTGALTGKMGVIVVSGKSFTATSATVNGGGGIDIYMNQASSFNIGGKSASIGSISLTGTSPINQGFVHVANKGTGGITIASESSITIDTPAQQEYLALNAGSGILSLPTGTISLDSNDFAIASGVIALSAGQINANGTTLSSTNTDGGFTGVVVLGTTNLNTGNGLTIRNNGAFGFVGMNGFGAVGITSTPGAQVDKLSVSFDGNNLRPITVSGQSLVASSDGFRGQVILNGSSMNLTASNILLSANGGNGAAGYVQIYGNQLVNNSNVQAHANGIGAESGGLVNIQFLGASADIQLASNELLAQATSGISGGNGGQINIAAGHLLSVDTNSVNVAVAGSQGNGGRITLVGGTGGVAAGGVLFTNENAILNADGVGGGQGGLIQVGAFGIDNNLVLPSISTNGGATGSGGQVEAFGGRSLTLNGSITANAGTAGNGQGGFVDLNAGFGTSGTLNANSTISANGSPTFVGGSIFLSSNGSLGDITIGNSSGDFVEANGKYGGQVYLSAGRTLNVNAPVSALGSDGFAGFIQADAGFEAPGDINVNSNIDVSPLSTTTALNGIFLTSHFGNVKIGSSTSNAQVRANGSEGVFIHSGLNTTVAAGSVVSSNGVSKLSGGTVSFRAGESSPGVLDVAGVVTANSPSTGKGGYVLLEQRSSTIPMLISGSVSANSAGGEAGIVEIKNLAGQQINARVTGTISATGVDEQSRGTLFLNNPGQAVMIDGSGEFNANIKARTAQVSFVTTRPDTVIRPYDLDSTGAITINGSGSGSIIDLRQGATVRSVGTVSFRAGDLKLGDGSINTSAPVIRGENVQITKTETGDLNLASDISADQILSIELQQDGSILQYRDANERLIGSISAGTASLTFKTGNAGFAHAPLVMNVDRVMLNSNTDSLGFSQAFLTVSPKSGSEVFLGRISIGRGTLDVTGVGGSLRVADNIETSNTISLNNADHDIIFGGGNVNSENDVIAFTDTGSIRQSGDSRVIAPTVVLSSLQGSVTAKTATSHLTVAAPEGSASINQDGDLDLTLVVRDNFELMIVNGSLLPAERRIAADSLNITALNGNIGNIEPIVTHVNNLIVNASQGGVFIQNKNSALTVNSSEAKGNLSIKSDGSLTTIGPVASTQGSVELGSGAGDLRISGIPFITAGNGNIVLQNRNTDGLIEFDFGTHLTATGDSTAKGNIFVVVGETAAQVDGTAPSNFIPAEVNGGHIYWGNNVVRPGDANTEQPNILGADGRTITFSGPNTQHVVFHGDARVTAQGPSSNTSGPPGHGGSPPGQVRPNPGQTGQTPGLGQAPPPGQVLFTPPGQIENKANPEPPGQQKNPPGQQKKAMKIENSEEFQPVAFFSIVQATASDGGFAESRSGKNTLWSSDRTKVRSRSNGDICFTEGELLVHAEKDMSIMTQHANFSVKSGALVLLETNSTGLVLHVLNDETNKSVSCLASDGQKIVLSTGDELCMSYDKYPSFFDNGLARRNEQTFKIANRNIMHAETSPLSLLSRNPLARRWFKYQSSGVNQIRNKLVKTVAAMAIVTSAHGAYKQK